MLSIGYGSATKKKRERIMDICNNIDESPNNYTECKNPDQKRVRILYCFIFVKLQEMQTNL